MLYPDRSKHDHGLHNVEDRVIEAHVKSIQDNTPHNQTDLLAVHQAELIPSRTDGSLEGDIARATAYQKHEGGTDMYNGERYEWSGEDLARRAADPNGFTKP